MILLDTDVVIDVLRRRAPALAWLASVSPQQIAIPGFAVMEVIDGCRDKRELQVVQAALAPYPVVWPTPADCDQALQLFASLRLSHSLGLIDALIAQMALSLDEPLHTFNLKHYGAVPGLRFIVPYIR